MVMKADIATSAVPKWQQEVVLALASMAADSSRIGGVNEDV